jgi:predicted RNA-binding protein YlqC (UPF0109 family)
VSAQAPTAQAVLLHLCQAVVAHPEEISIEVADKGSEHVQLNVTVARDDMGRVIGRRGRVATAIRTVVRAAATKDGLTADVEFVD